MSVNRDVV